MLEKPIVRFGSFELDTRSRELVDGSKRVRLQDQSFAILSLLVERAGQVVSREELCGRLWPAGTFVDYEHSLNAAVKRLRVALTDDAARPRFIETVPRVGYRFAASAVSVAAAHPDIMPARPGTRLAVLPFTSLGDEGQEYFADGLTEDMISQLGHLCRGRVGVIARWSSMTFKGTTERARDIGRALNADFLLEGSVRVVGERTRITARLVASAEETQIWAETYDRHMADRLQVQADVAARIARSLALELAPGVVDVSRARPTSAPAYQEYLKGRYHWNRLDDDRRTGTDSAILQALSCFDRAIALDSDFAAAHASAAHVHIARAQQYLTEPRPALEAARALARRALELDPDVAEAHTALGDVRRMLDWDWVGAEQAYLTAIALNPSQENAHRRHAFMLVARGRGDDAIGEADMARELDPFCLVVGVSGALVRYLAGDYECAREHSLRVMALDPSYLPARRLLGAILLQLGRPREAIEMLASVHEEGPTSPVVVAWLAHANAVAGDRRAAARWLDRWWQFSPERYLSPYYLALAHAGLGASDDAFRALEQAIADRDPALAYLAVEPRFTPLRGDSRFAAVLERIGLAPADVSRPTTTSL